MFHAVEEGRLSLPYAYPETAQSTRRLVSVLIWLLGLVLAYPYLPGSNSDAFKGVSVFLGVVLSLGSSGIVNQIMSGLTITYSRAVRPGDFVRIGDVEGTITQLGTLSTKIKTPRREEVTIPNAVVDVPGHDELFTVRRYGRCLRADVADDRLRHPVAPGPGALAAGGRANPGGTHRARAGGAADGARGFLHQYTLLVCLENPQLRSPTLDALHANILDAFNEYGVQITSPNYEADPEARKIVPVDQWYAAPAGPADTVAEQVRR